MSARRAIRTHNLPGVEDVGDLENGDEGGDEDEIPLPRLPDEQVPQSSLPSSSTLRGAESPTQAKLQGADDGDSPLSLSAPPSVSRPATSRKKAKGKTAAYIPYPKRGINTQQVTANDEDDEITAAKLVDEASSWDQFSEFSGFLMVKRRTELAMKMLRPKCPSRIRSLTNLAINVSKHPVK